MKEKVLEILAKYAIPAKAVDDVILKEGQVALTIDLSRLALDKNSAQKAIKESEKAIKSQLNFAKVMIILTADKKLNVNDDVVKNHAQPDEKDAKTVMKNLRGEEILPVVGVKKIIAIASAKGGVGKSSLAANLAISLQRIGYKMALVDADIYGPSIPHLMNIDSKPVNKDGLITPLMSQNVKCISVGSLIDPSAAGIWRGPMITKILYQLIRSVDWRADGNDVDCMIIDMPPGTGDVYLSLAEKFPLNGVVIISTPQSLAVIDVVRSIDCFQKLQIPILGLIQNMSYLENNGVKQYIFGRDGAKDLAKKMSIKFLGEVPLMQEISDAGEARVPITAAKPNAEISMLIGRIAEEIIDSAK